MCPTHNQPNQIEWSKFQPATEIGLGRLELQRMSNGSVGVEHLKNGKDPARKR